MIAFTPSLKASVESAIDLVCPSCPGADEAARCGEEPCQQREWVGKPRSSRLRSHVVALVTDASGSVLYQASRVSTDIGAAGLGAAELSEIPLGREPTTRRRLGCARDPGRVSAGQGTQGGDQHGHDAKHQED